MSRSQRWFRYDRDILLAVTYFAVILAIPQEAFAWAREGCQTIVIVADHYKRPLAPDARQRRFKHLAYKAL